MTPSMAAPPRVLQRRHLAQQVAQRSQLTPQQSARALDALVEAVLSSLQQGRAVTLPGLGTFRLRPRAARHRLGPKVCFQASLALRATLSGEPPAPVPET